LKCGYEIILAPKREISTFFGETVKNQIFADDGRQKNCPHNAPYRAAENNQYREAVIDNQSGVWIIYTYL